MYLSAQYDPHSSKLSEKLTFYCEKFEFSQRDFLDLKEQKYIRLMEWEYLPENIPCQVLIYCEGFQKAKVIFFNHTFQIPVECYDEPLLNKNLIEWSREHGGFWVEFLIPLEDPAINLDFSVSL